MAVRNCCLASRCAKLLHSESTICCTIVAAAPALLRLPILILMYWRIRSLMKEVYAAVQSHGGWAWPMFGGDEIQRATCADLLRRACKQENGPIAYMFDKGALASLLNLCQQRLSMSADGSVG